MAQALALVGKRIIFLDLDPHENASNTLRLKDVHPSLYDLMTAERTTRGFDAIIMDTPPTLDILTVNALTSADTVIVPVGPDGYSLAYI